MNNLLSNNHSNNIIPPSDDLCSFISQISYSSKFRKKGCTTIPIYDESIFRELVSYVKNTDTWFQDMENNLSFHGDGIAITFTENPLGLNFKIISKISDIVVNQYQGYSGMKKQHEEITNNPGLAFYNALASTQCETSMFSLDEDNKHDGISILTPEISVIGDTTKQGAFYALDGIQLELSGNPRDFTPEAWALYNADSKYTQPEYQVSVGEFTFFLTKKSVDKQNILGYVMFQGKYHARYFYFSGSGGNWHCAPGQDSDFLSKGEFYIQNGNKMSYEKGTIIDRELAKFLGGIPFSNQENGEHKKLWKKNCTAISNPSIEKNIIKDLENDNIKLYTLIPEIRSFAGTFGHDPAILSLFPGITYEEYLNSFQNAQIPNELLENFKYIGKGKSGYHPILKEAYDIYICESTFQGEKINIEIAKSGNPPNTCWIENIVFSQNSISSWGFLRRQINAGFLASKPIEYNHQCPKFIDPIGNPNGMGKIVDKESGYVDIRPFIQKNPLIQAFQKIIR